MLEVIGRFVSSAAGDQRTRIIAVAIIFVVFGSAAFLIAWILDTTRLPLVAHGTIDAVILGSLAAFTSWFLLEAARRERMRLRRELENEARLNHEVRNALEVIGQAGYLISDVTLKNVVSDSVQKIDSILKERKPPKE